MTNRTPVNEDNPIFQRPAADTAPIEVSDTQKRINNGELLESTKPGAQFTGGSMPEPAEPIAPSADGLDVVAAEPSLAPGTETEASTEGGAALAPEAPQDDHTPPAEG